MGDALRERLSDAGSIPARSIKAADLVCRLCQFTEPRKEISGLRQHAAREDYENEKTHKISSFGGCLVPACLPGSSSDGKKAGAGHAARIALQDPAGL